MSQNYFLGFMPKPHMWVIENERESWHELNKDIRRTAIERRIALSIEGDIFSIKVTKTGVVWISSQELNLTVEANQDFYSIIDQRKKLVNVANAYNYLLSILSILYTSGFSTRIYPIEVSMHETMSMNFSGTDQYCLNEPTTFIPTCPGISHINFTNTDDCDGQILVRAYQEAFNNLEMICNADLDNLNKLNTLSKSESEYINGDYNTSLILSWFTIENSILHIFLNEAGGKTKNNGHSPQIDHMVNQIMNIIDYKQFPYIIENLAQIKNARNGLAHRNKCIDRQTAEMSLRAAIELLSYLFPVDLKHDLVLPSMLSYSE